MKRPLETSIAKGLLLQNRLQQAFLQQQEHQSVLVAHPQIPILQQEGEPGGTVHGDLTGDPTQQQQQQQQAPPPGQQQQQQQAPPPPDPFKDIDLNMLDETTRNAIVTGRTEIARLHGRALTASQLQSERDKLLHANGQYQQQLQHAQSQRPKQQQQQQAEPTMEDKLCEMLMATGLTETQARPAAKYQASMLDMFGATMEAKIGQRFAPVVGNVMQQNAVAAFNEVKSKDELGILQIPEVAEAVYQSLNDMSARGEMATSQVAENLAAIYYYKHIRENGGTPNMTPNIPQPPAPPQVQQTRFTYPGAGIHARPPLQQNNGPAAMTAEESVALAATTAAWPVQPKGFQQNTPQHKVFVTRNGVSR